MQQIADEAGIAKGTLYLYFKDKEDLLASVADSELDKLRAEIDRAFLEETGLEETLRHIVAAQFTFFEEHSEIFRVYHEVAGVGRMKHKRDCHPRFQAFLDRLAGLFRRAMAKGELRKANPEGLAIFMVEGTFGIIVRRIAGARKGSLKDEVELVVGTILRGMQAGRSRR